MSRRTKTFNNYPFPYLEELELNIESLSNLGDGVAKVSLNDTDGSEKLWTIFTPLTLPGEKVRVQIWRNAKNCSHAKLVKVLEPSPDRVQPPCPQFGRCGGCQYQHLTYAEQLKWKQKQVADALSHLAGISHPVNETLPSPEEWEYRSKITPHLQKSKKGQIQKIGFLQKGSQRDLVAFDSCAIALSEINHALPRVFEGIKSRPKSYKNGETILLRANSERVFENPREIISEEVGGLTFHFLAGDFFQNNPFILPSFVDYVKKQAGTDNPYLVDAY